MQDFAIAGVMMLALAFGIVEFAKKHFGVEGKACVILYTVLCAAFAGLKVAIGQGLIPADIIPIIEMVITTISAIMSGMGFYHFAKKATGRKLSG